MDGDEKSVLVWYGEGREACLGGTAKESNPYPAGEQSHDCWDRGWNDAAGQDDREQGYT